MDVFGGTEDPADSLRGENLAADGLGTDASGRVDSRAEQVSVFADGLSCVQADAQLKLLLGGLGTIAFG